MSHQFPRRSNEQDLRHFLRGLWPHFLPEAAPQGIGADRVVLDVQRGECSQGRRVCQGQGPVGANVVVAQTQPGQVRQASSFTKPSQMASAASSPDLTDSSHYRIIARTEAHGSTGVSGLA